MKLKAFVFAFLVLFAIPKACAYDFSLSVCNPSNFTGNLTHIRDLYCACALKNPANQIVWSEGPKKIEKCCNCSVSYDLKTEGKWMFTSTIMYLDKIWNGSDWIIKQGILLSKVKEVEISKGSGGNGGGGGGGFAIKEEEEYTIDENKTKNKSLPSKTYTYTNFSEFQNISERKGETLNNKSKNPVIEKESSYSKSGEEKENVWYYPILAALVVLIAVGIWKKFKT